MPATSKSQQRLFGMVHAYQKGEMDDAPESVKRIAKSISREDARHFAETKHKGLPEKKKKKLKKAAAYALGFMKAAEDMGYDGAALLKMAAPTANPFPIFTERIIRSPLRSVLGRKKVPFRRFQYLAENAGITDIGMLDPGWREASNSWQRKILKQRLLSLLSDYGVEPHRGNIRLLESLPGVR